MIKRGNILLQQVEELKEENELLRSQRRWFIGTIVAAIVLGGLALSVYTYLMNLTMM